MNHTMRYSLLLKRTLKPVPGFAKGFISHRNYAVNNKGSMQSILPLATTLKISPRTRFFSTSSENLQENPNIRNVAIVAHVDHGKTTLVDALLSACGDGSTLNARTMDSNDLEKERGITILSKVTSLTHRGVTVNVVDTPGHSDFAGEVERALAMVDGVCLLIDATDGPMAQSKYVLSKALKLGLKPLVIINKVDRPTARVASVEDEVLDLFCNLECSDEQLDFKTIYACGKDGWASNTLEDNGEEKNMLPLLDALIDHTPPPKVNPDGPFKMLVSMMESDSTVHLGNVLLTGKVLSGSAELNKKVKILNPDGSTPEEAEASILKIFTRDGMTRRELNEAEAGNIVTLAGVTGGRVADTICDPLVTEPLKTQPLDPSTISVLMSVNDSIYVGNKDVSGGNKLTSQMIKARLMKEVESNVAVQIKVPEVSEDDAERDAMEVHGRGEMQLGILIENMRREGFEVSISPPKALFKTDDNGKVLEPIEEVTVITSEEYVGTIIEALVARKGDMMDSIVNEDGQNQITFLVPARGMVGLRSELMKSCSGNAVVNTIFDSYQPHKGNLGQVRKGVLISSSDGVSTEYALSALEPRGQLFIGAGEKVYTGMIIGEHNRSNDLDVNVCKGKKLTNIRASGTDESTRLQPPRIFQLEDCIGYIEDDELVEVTPLGVRMRKAILDPSKRKIKKSKKKK